MSIGNEQIPDVDRATESSSQATTATTAKAAATDVAAEASDGIKEIATEVTTQAQQVAGEAKRQLSSIVDQTRAEFADQAEARTSQAATGLRTLAGQVEALAQGRPQDAGDLAGYLDDARSRLTKFSDRLDDGGPQGLLDDVSAFARRRPLVFLAATAGAGFLVGRLARAGSAASGPDGPNLGATTPTTFVTAAAPAAAAPAVLAAPPATTLP